MRHDNTTVDPLAWYRTRSGFNAVRADIFSCDDFELKRRENEMAWRLNHVDLNLLYFLRATAGTAKRVLAIVILSVCPSRHGTDSSPGEIE